MKSAWILNNFSIPNENKDKFEHYFIRYFYYLYNIAITRFKWINLPDEIDPVFLENMLFYYGKGAFFKDDIANLYAVMKVNESGEFDIYDHGEQRYAYAINYQIELTKDNSVLLYDSMCEYPSADILSMHAYSLAQMRISRDINIIANRTPVIVSSSTEQALTGRNIMKQIIDGIPFIHLKKGIYGNENLQALKTDAPVLFNDLNTAMRWEMSDALTYLGVDSFYSDKKERAVSGETSGNNGEVEMNRNSCLMRRKRSCEQINKLFGLNVDVEFRSEIPIFTESEV